MRSFLRVFATAFVLLVIVVANVSDMAGPVGAEARTCESKSEHYRRMCVKHNCVYVCQTEGFTGGYCRGFFRRCFCTKNCK